MAKRKIQNRTRWMRSRGLRVRPTLEILDGRLLLSANPIVTENQLPGTPESVWLVPQGQSNTDLQGFTTDISVDVGQTISFKITDTTLDPYVIDIYRIGYYQGNGARLVTTIPSSQTLRQNQPAPMYNSATGEWDAGNWAVSASWAVPSTTVSGVFLADLVDTKTGGMSMIVFVVRDDASHSQILFKVDDATWQAYNEWGDANGVLGTGNSLYTGTGPSSYQGAAYAVSYNRPLNNYNNTSETNIHDEFFYAEFPMVEWLEENGYNVSYFTDVDADRYGSLILNHQVFMDVGHDEYWSGNEFDNILAARNAGVDMAFFAGNQAFWKTYYSTSLDSSATAYRTLVCYKETHLNAIADPTNPNIWTGSFADPRFNPPADGGIAQNELTGTFFDVNQGPDVTGTPITVPGTDANLPIWRNTAVAKLAPGQSMTIGGQVLGYEWDSDVNNGFRPVGEIDLSSTTQNVPQGMVDWGNTFVPQTETNSQIEYRASSGALVFSAGTVQWSWGLSNDHFGTDNLADPDPNMQQATVNLFADMGVQPGTLQAGLVPATQTALSSTPPTSAITWPPPGASLPSGTPVTITGTASAAKGAFVVAVEVSTDGGKTWNPAQGTTNWSYTWTPGATGPVTIMSRAVDDTVNLGPPSTGDTVNVTQPTGSLTLFGLSAAPVVAAANDPTAVNVGVRFSSDIPGYISGIRFYKGPGNNGTHVGYLWTSTGTLLASVTFTQETASGWQEADFSNPVAITAGTTYVASYYAPDGDYPADTYAFALSGVNNGPLHVPLDLPTNPASVYAYGAAGTFPKSTSNSTNYWVDVVYSPTTTVTPRVNSVSPTPGAGGIATNTAVTATFNESIQVSTLSFLLTDSSGNVVPATLGYDDTTHTATLTPKAPLNFPATYTATLSGATDQHGVTMPGSVSWSFNTSFQVGTTYSFWNNTTKPTITSYNDAQPVEVGVLFESSVAGTISAIRFYDGNSESLNSDGDTGDTYVVHLWTSTGVLLASANYTLNDDSNLGWQQVNFSSPVTIAANTVYVASYYAPDGGYAVDIGYFANSGVTSGPIHALSNTEAFGLDGGTISGNGLYLDKTGGGFPTNTYAGTNYWVDPVFNVTGSNPPPKVLTQNPAPGTTGVSTDVSPISATFNEAVQPGSISFALTDSSGHSVTGSLSYSATTNTISFIPNGALNTSTQYTATISGATDSFGNTMSPVSWSFTTTSTVTAWSNSTTPTLASTSDTSAIDVGVKFETDASGYVDGIRFYKGTGNTGTHVGDLWSSTGTLLTSATFTNETASGWQQVTFANPVLITAETVYVASYYAPNGGYAVNSAYFASSGVTSGPLHILSNAEAGGNGVFTYGTGFPTSSYNATNYWVDVIFNPLTVNAPPPTVNAQAPASGSTDASTLTTISAAFSEPIQPSTVSFTVTDASGNPVSGSLSYQGATNTATFTPSAPLAKATKYTVTVSGATDSFGNTMTPASWSFTTSAASTIWSNTTAPANPSVSDSAAIEVGVKFESSTTGYIDGIRFYKGAGNTGTHVGYLWTSTGALLASATFTNETATGWQQVTFANPVPIAANTVYVASYYAPNGDYAADSGYFASSGVTSSPLTALSNTAAGGNGVFTYGTGGAFPTSSYNGTNYWVDVSFTAGGVNTTPPTVTAQTPAPNATGVSTLTSVSATFSEPVQSGTPSLTLTDASGHSVSGSLGYNVTTNTVTFIPNASLATSTKYTATVSGATDAFGNTMAPVSWSFTTATTATDTLWSSAATPANPSAADTSAIELGVKFESDAAGFITGIRFYKGSGNTGTHVGYLWTSAGALLATATFTGETASGWQQVTFANPVAITANTVYVASYYTPNGGYAADGGYFASSGVTSGPLTALSNATGNGNGVYLYGTGGGFPTSSYNATNYWVDVMFNSTPPTVVGMTPGSGAVDVLPGSPITAIFSEPVQVGTVSFGLKNSLGQAILGTLSYDATTNSAIFTPNAPLAASTQYTATVSGAQNLAGDVMTSPVSWSFTTAAGGWTQSTLAAFSAGTQSNTMVTATAGGQVSLASIFSDNFQESSLSSAWTTSSWASAGGGPTSVTLSGGVLSVGGAEVLSTQTIPNGVGVDGSVDFGAAPYQNFGMATGLSSSAGNYWALFGTGGTANTLFAQVNVSGTTQAVSLGALPSGFHDYRIQPVSGGIQFSVDGVVLTTINLTIPSGTPLAVTMSAFSGAPQPALQVDSVSMTSYASSGTFTSSVFDAGSNVAWGIAAWTANVPAGTTLTVQTSSSTDGVNWSAWSTVTNGGTITSPSGRYLRYEIVITTTNPAVTAILSTISFTWG